MFFSSRGHHRMFLLRFVKALVATFLDSCSLMLCPSQRAPGRRFAPSPRHTSRAMSAFSRTTSHWPPPLTAAQVVGSSRSSDSSLSDRVMRLVGDHDVAQAAYLRSRCHAACQGYSKMEPAKDPRPTRQASCRWVRVAEGEPTACSLARILAYWTPKKVSTTGGAARTWAQSVG